MINIYRSQWAEVSMSGWKTIETSFSLWHGIYR